jgi:hypothetical protein
MTDRWIGGASVRLRSVGMFNVPRRFATLSLTPGRVLLEVRPASFTRRLPGYPWTLTPSQQPEIFPVRATGFKRGVGFRKPGQKPYYFWCGRARDDILDALETAGFAVSRTERRPEYR